MFIHDLGSHQQRAFFTLLHKMVQADKKLVEEEKTARVLLKRESGLDSLPDPNSLTPAEAADEFTSHSDRVIVLLELLLIAHVDDDYHPEEKELIQDLAGRFNIGMEKLELLKNWALRQGALVREAEELRHT